MSLFDKFNPFANSKNQQPDIPNGAQNTSGTDAGNTDNGGKDDLRKQPITSDMIVGDILSLHPEAAELLMQCGMSCISCPASLMESLADACMVHALNGDEVTEYLNESLELI